MTYKKTEIGEYNLFDSLLNSWNGEEYFNREKMELNKQIDMILNLQSGLAQSSQGQPEDWDFRRKMEDEIQMLGLSVNKALGLK